MTLDVLHQRPATSCGKVSHQSSGLALASNVLAKKKKKSAAIHIGTRKTEDIPEQSDDEEKSLASKSKSHGKTNNSTTASKTKSGGLDRAREAGRARVLDETMQLTNMLRLEEAKLSQQLLIVSEKGNKHAAYLLLHQGIDMSRCKGMSGYSPLHYAATRGHLEVIQLLLDFGWPINTATDNLETPLHLAAYNGHAHIAECLLDRGANVNALNNDEETPLFYAARKNHYRIVRLLIRRECNLALKNRFGDIAEDDASHEKTQMELTVGKEDAQRLYSARSKGSELTTRRDTLEREKAAAASSEQLISQQQREHILSFLDLKSLCLSSQVSYRWHRAADNPSLWHKLGVSRWELLLNATMGIGAVSPMMHGGLRLGLSKSSSSSRNSSSMSNRRPSSCDQGNSRFVASSVKRKSVLRLGDDQRPQTARLCGAAGF